MPNWKKLIVSGSDANLSNLVVSQSITASAFSGDGSGLTNVSTTISEYTSKEDTFSNTTTHSISHNFASKNINVIVYDDNDDVFIPARINTPSTASVVIYMDPATSGRAVISRGGHILTGSIEIISSSTVSDTFSSATTHSVSHTLGTKDVIVSVYDNNDDVFIPARINTPTTSSVVLYMDPATTGRVVIGKAGHIVSGSSLLDGTGVISGSSQLPSNLISSSAQLAASISGSLGANSTLIRSLTAATISGSFNSVSSSISTRLTTSETELSNTLLSSSAQIAANISGSFNSVSSSIATELNNATGSVSLNTRDSSTFAFWQGSQAQYDALGSYDSNVIYFTT